MLSSILFTYVVVPVMVALTFLCLLGTVVCLVGTITICSWQLMKAIWRFTKLIVVAYYADRPNGLGGRLP